jgi:O-antigen ligase
MVLSLYFISDWVFDIRSVVASLAGRDATLTGRTDLWKYLSTVDINWLLGTGYESFWLGSRFQNALALFRWGPTQAHNGYREMYLNLGMLGLSVLTVLLFVSYRKICKGLTKDFGPALLGLTLWSTVLCYNVTEAAFKSGHVLWFSFLLVSLSIPSLRTQSVRSRVDLSRNQRLSPQIRPIPQRKTTEQRYSYRVVEKRD